MVEQKHWHPLGRKLSPNNKQISNKLVLFKAEPGVYMLLLSSRIQSMKLQTFAQARPQDLGLSRPMCQVRLRQNNHQP